MWPEKGNLCISADRCISINCSTKGGGSVLDEVVRQSWLYGRGFLLHGKVADYIPELSKANPVYLGISIKTLSGETIEFGDVTHRFTIQSISKVITLAMALEKLGYDEVFTHVMMEPSGDSFNSILKLDTASNRPYNPMINAGAIDVIGLLAPVCDFDELLAFSRKLCQDDEITMDYDVYHSESITGDRNRAIGYLLKSKGVLAGDALAAVDLYIRMCSLSVTAKSLAGLGQVLAAGGVIPETEERVLSANTVRVIQTLMFTCGMYDRSGELAVRVGIPSKSGVGGGIMSCVTDRMGIGIYGPSLDDKGNSIGGANMLEYLSKELRLHVFDAGRMIW
ncbi:MAG: glutaminase A [Lachnospiraceae bacterium]|nr:glutaminase A [Lachnospiraceae bacterium]